MSQEGQLENRSARGVIRKSSLETGPYASRSRTYSIFCLQRLELFVARLLGVQMVRDLDEARQNHFGQHNTVDAGLLHA